MGRLKGIPKILSPDLLHVLASMGHGDEIVLCDANFPASSVSRHGPKYVDASGHGIPDLLRAVMKFFPLDTYVSSPVAVMDRVQSDKEKGLKVVVWDTYRNIVSNSNGSPVELDLVERFDFYKRAKSAFAVVATGETAAYGNIILTKGVICNDDE